MSTSEAQKRATKKWQSEKVEDVKFRVPKGEKLLIQQHAARQGESVNAFLYRATLLCMEQDNDL